MKQWIPIWSTGDRSGVLNIRRAWNCWSKSPGGHKGDTGDGAPPPWRQAGRAGNGQPGEEKGVWKPPSTFQELKGLQGNHRGKIHQELQEPE